MVSSSVRVSSAAAAAAAASQDSQQVLGSHRRSFHLPDQLPSNLRFKNTARLQVRQTLFTVLASSNPGGAGEDSIQDKSDETKTNQARQGPPLLTIVAGFLVFFLACWLVGFTVMWPIGLIVKLFLSK